MSEYNIREMIDKKKGKSGNAAIEKAVPIILLIITLVSVLTTIGILVTLLTETVMFFTRVSPIEFLTSTEWSAFSSDPQWGIFALIMGTLKITAIAIVFAVPVGLGAAIYLSEYASDRIRRLVKPVLEILAGIPTVVYGFFALTFVTPLIRGIWPEVNLFNAISPGLVVGVMIIPMIASLSEDAMSAVPNSMREGALGLGSTRLEMVLKVVLPAAVSGIMASIVLAVSRAIGETMIVSIAAGSTPNGSLNLMESLQTMTGFIVQVASGDATYGTDTYFSLYAVGMTLFVFTLLMNIIAQWFSRKFREEY
ncbi:phosphate ABC transporter permease subunit PstC [Salinicoccus hispanicus]|uniref:Phosphate transport system permease protein n=1 Tax=Salinicoccus hispanicus TaxID=157225 RepID=A0A6N8TZS0_9STAP|nr:phosphate ABC transporter permease subunit PstC [Salinicoccus hispanicus]MXQ50186.1 phosphate ABC transporter permease subunit PstC [Salinicoccus hispanicus]